MKRHEQEGLAESSGWTWNGSIDSRRRGVYIIVPSYLEEFLIIALVFVLYIVTLLAPNSNTVRLVFGGGGRR